MNSLVICEGCNNVVIKIYCMNCMFSIHDIIPLYCIWRLIFTTSVSDTSVYFKFICKFLPRTGKNNMIVADVKKIVTIIYVHSKCLILYKFILRSSLCDEHFMMRRLGWQNVVHANFPPNIQWWFFIVILCSHKNTNIIF